MPRDFQGRGNFRGGRGGGRGNGRGHFERRANSSPYARRGLQTARRSRPFVPRGDYGRPESARSNDSSVAPQPTFEENQVKDGPASALPTEDVGWEGIDGGLHITSEGLVWKARLPNEASKPTKPDQGTGESIKRLSNLTERAIPGVPAYLCQELVDRALPKLLVYDLCKELRLSLEADDRAPETIQLAQRRLKWLLGQRIEELSESCDIEIENDWGYLFG